ncbi:MAG: RNA methyltransferase, partial [Pseudomonadota bacterium]
MARQELKVVSLGALGDGVAEQNIFVPGALPGEIVEAEIDKGRAHTVSLIQESSSRIEPVCQHFGDCGGCRVQHMDGELYAQWKAGLVSDALLKVGIEIELEPMIGCVPRTRRRAVFSVVVKTDGVDVGFQRANSN